jgi:hypothetical protein
LAHGYWDARGTTYPEDGSADVVGARRGAIAAQRAALEELRDSEGLAPRLVRQIERELDQEELACLTNPDGELPHAQ